LIEKLSKVQKIILIRYQRNFVLYVERSEIHTAAVTDAMYKLKEMSAKADAMVESFQQ
jgi:hypothetical protein